MIYTDEDGVEHPAETVIEENAPGDVGPALHNFRPIAEQFGYGKYTLRLEATGDDDSLIEDTIEFEYVAIDASSSDKSEAGNPYVDLDFDQDQDSLTDDMKIYVTTNYLTSKRYIKNLLDENYSYLVKMINNMCKKNEKKDLFFYLGNSYDIIFVNDLKKVDVDSNNYVIYASDIKQLNRWYNKVIKDTFIERFTYIYNMFDEVTVMPSLRIRKMKSRWGVYNRVKHSVTLNSELIKYNIRCLDYVIVHELSHVIYFDHSKCFWSLVSKYCNNYKNIKKELKE